MNLSINELLFYGGLLLTAVSVILCIIFGILSKNRALRILSQLEKEYGERSTPRKKEGEHANHHS